MLAFNHLWIYRDGANVAKICFVYFLADDLDKCFVAFKFYVFNCNFINLVYDAYICLLYTSDAADE